MADRQTNYTIGEGLTLPSKGLIYNKPVNEYVELRSMTARDEMKRLSPAASQFKKLSDIIEGCMIEKPAVKVYDMALGDYEFLLHKLRTVTYGDEYKMELKCPFCGAKIEPIAHLDNLGLTVIDQEEYEKLRTITLPTSGKLVTISFQTPHILDLIEIRAKELRRKFKNAEIEFEALARLQLGIEAVDGVALSEFQIEEFINKLSARDMLKIENSILALNTQFGVNNKLEITCDQCGGEVATYFRYGPEFFRPSTI